jgi:TM2 domain-containing membrane protein YozV
MKNRGIAIVLALFLGGFGIHKFYLGQVKTGMTYLLFCWTGIPLILSIFDFFVLLFTGNKKFHKKYDEVYNA